MPATHISFCLPCDQSVAHQPHHTVTHWVARTRALPQNRTTADSSRAVSPTRWLQATSRRQTSRPGGDKSWLRFFPGFEAADLKLESLSGASSELGVKLRFSLTTVVIDAALPEGNHSESSPSYVTTITTTPTHTVCLITAAQEMFTELLLKYPSKWKLLNL